MGVGRVEEYGLSKTAISARFAC